MVVQEEESPFTRNVLKRGNYILMNKRSLLLRSRDDGYATVKW